MANKDPKIGTTTLDNTDTDVTASTRGSRMATDAMTDVARGAATALDENRSRAADGLDAAASTLYERADQLPGGEQVRGVAHATADRLSTGAEYVRTHSPRQMMADVHDIVRKNPGPALAIAAVFGFFLGRTLHRD